MSHTKNILPKIHFTAITATLMATIGVSTMLATGLGSPGTRCYPICPEKYDTYCCTDFIPFVRSCSRAGICITQRGWACVSGPSKVDSIRYSLEEVGGDMQAY